METFTTIEDDYPPAVRKTICDVLGTFTTQVLHWNIPDKDHRKLKSPLDNEVVDRPTNQDDFLPTNNKFYQRVFKLKGFRGVNTNGVTVTTDLLEENYLKTF
jgi:hypothetical protein